MPVWLRAYLVVMCTIRYTHTVGILMSLRIRVSRRERSPALPLSWWLRYLGSSSSCATESLSSPYPGTPLSLLDQKVLGDPLLRSLTPRDWSDIIHHLFLFIKIKIKLKRAKLFDFSETSSKPRSKIHDFRIQIELFRKHIYHTNNDDKYISEENMWMFHGERSDFYCIVERMVE